MKDVNEQEFQSLEKDLNLCFDQKWQSGKGEENEMINVITSFDIYTLPEPLNTDLKLETSRILTPKANKNKPYSPYDSDNTSFQTP